MKKVLKNMIYYDNDMLFVKT